MDVEKALAALKKNGFAARYFATPAEAADAICAEITGKTVGIGGSITVEQMGLFDRLSQSNEVYWHWRQPPAEAQKNAMTAEVYLLSANAVSETGELVNIDGTGNRVAASLYGHERVIFLVGVNKLTPTLEDAVRRARNVAAPLNARRLERKTPCACTEPMRCHDCSSPERICCGMNILLHKMFRMETEVVLIDEELGL